MDLGTLSGTGRLKLSNGKEGEAIYTIQVWKDHSGFKNARGTMEADEGLLFDAVGNDATLELEGGGTVKLIVSNYPVGGGDCEFVVSGPVPGF